MKVEGIKYVYLIGAGGIGMSALGRYFLQRGIAVAGYDKTPTALTTELEKEGMILHFEDNPSLIPSELLSLDKSEVLVIITPAIPKEHAEMAFFRQHGYTMLKRAEVLGLISRAHTTLAVAGTHGKTTTSTMLAHILKVAGLEPVAFLGGISSNYHSNYLQGTVDSPLVAEADEYDRSFLHLQPDISIITSVDADHLDIYGHHSELLDSFTQFARNSAKLILKAGLELPAEVSASAIRYSVDGDAEVRAENLRLSDGLYHFDLNFRGTLIEGLSLGQPGKHNVENAIAASAAALLYGVKADDIRRALAAFRGVKRRFEYILREPSLVFVDDYAHHPQEIATLIKSLRSIYPGKKITGVFQPHLFSRTLHFYDEFAQELARLDELLLLEIYPARELPVEGVTSAELLKRIGKGELVSKQELPEKLVAMSPEVLVTMGAGDIDLLVEPIRQSLSKTLAAS